MAKYRFEQIAINSKEKKKPAEEDRFTYIGLEHLDTGSLNVTRFGSDVAPIGEKLVMRKGDVLFGKRRAYQKKVAIAPFDGIFSAHGMVLRPQEKVVDRKFFPLFISSDYFLDAAIKISVGSLSPTINWRDLKDLEFELPDLDTQKELAEVLWAINDTIESYKKLISVTDELVKSQFIEMFGDPRSNPYGHTCRPLSAISEIMSGITKGRKIKGTRTIDVPYICTANVQDGYVDWTEKKYMPATEEEISKYSLLCDDVLIIEGGDPDKVGRGCLAGTLPDPCIYQNHVFRIRVDKDLISPEFLAAYLLLPSTKKYFLSCAKQTTGIATINKKQLSDLLVMFPDSIAQNDYIAFVRQSDKSKFELEQALSELTATYKRIISEQLG